MTNKEREVIRAVGRLYRSSPGVLRFEMKQRPDGTISHGEDCYRWYREPWMTEMLNAYRTMLLARKRERAVNRKDPAP